LLNGGTEGANKTQKASRKTKRGDPKTVGERNKEHQKGSLKDQNRQEKSGVVRKKKHDRLRRGVCW